MSPHHPLSGKRVAILVEDLYEDIELISPRDALQEAGALVTMVGPTAGRRYTGKKGDGATAEVAAGSVNETDFDALVVPGGYAPDKMRMRPAMVDLVRAVFNAGKPVAAICHGASVLINANVLRGRTLTCWPSIAVDVKNAGGRYVDKPLVEDGNLITSRKPDDLPQFNDAIIRQLAKGARAGSLAAKIR
jgi:protease I